MTVEFRDDVREHAPRGEPGMVQFTISLGLAQFLADVRMSNHDKFDAENPHHVKLLEEFVDLKRKIREEVEPAIAFHELLHGGGVDALINVLEEAIEEAIEEDKNVDADEERVRAGTDGVRREAG